MTIEFQLDDPGIATITIDRPERMNAMDAEHYALPSDAWTRVRDDPAIRVAAHVREGTDAFRDKRAPRLSGS
jgi:E-phenylitaconyl-CoA hydratase